MTVTENWIAACANPVVIASPNLPDSDTLVRRPVTAEGLMTSATPLPLDTFIVVLSDVTLVPPPSSPPMSVQAVVSALKLKLPLLWAKAGTTPNAAMTSARERIMADFIRDLLEGRASPRLQWEDHENPGGNSALFR